MYTTILHFFGGEKKVKMKGLHFNEKIMNSVKKWSMQHHRISTEADFFYKTDKWWNTFIL